MEIELDMPMLKVLAQCLRANVNAAQLPLKRERAFDPTTGRAHRRNWPEITAFPASVTTSLDAAANWHLASRYGQLFSLETLRQALKHPAPLSASQKLCADQSVHSSGAGGKVLTYVEMDEAGVPTGRRVSLANVELVPLEYADLAGKKLGHKVTIPLSWKRAKVVESNIPEITVEDLASGQATLESPYSSKTIGLVKGGWLPSGLALRDEMIVLPDRCTISELSGRFRNGAKKKDEDKDFLDLFAGERVRINPLLFALEGNQKSNPTLDVVAQQFEEACTKIRSALPLAELIPNGKGGLQGVSGIIQDTQAGMARKQDFLMRLAPELQAPVSAKRMGLLWNEVLATARDCGVPKKSLAVLAALSAIAVPNGRSPAKGVLKLRNQPYSAEMAYNALADLRALEVLIALLTLFPHQRLMLCTGDKDLALFWTGIQASDFAWIDGHASFKLSPVEDLLPGVTPKQRATFFDTSA